METEVQIDLAKYPVKTILAILVLILTVLSSMGEKSRAIELNSLPENRNELTSITGTKLSWNGNGITAAFETKCIFQITMDQHIRFMKVGLAGDGFTCVMNTSGDTQPQTKTLEEIQFSFNPPVHGHVKTQLMRGRTVLNQSDFQIDHSWTHKSRTEIATSGRVPYGRRMNISNVCWNGRTFTYFGKSEWLFDDPLIRFNSHSEIGGKKGNPDSFDEYLTFKNTQSLQGTTLIVSLDDFDPLSWGWITRTAAPLLSLVKEYHPDQVVAIHGTNIGYLDKFTKISLVRDEPICADFSVVEHLRKSPDSTRMLREVMVKGDTEMTESVVILTSNRSNFIVTNIEDLARGVCSKCSIEKVVAENETVDEIAEKVSRAMFVIAPHWQAVSQALWARGTLIELIPEETECDGWTREVSSAAGIKHLRFSVGIETRVAETVGECEGDIPESAYNRTVTVSVAKVVSEVAKMV